MEEEQKSQGKLKSLNDISLESSPTDIDIIPEDMIRHITIKNFRYRKSKILFDVSRELKNKDVSLYTRYKLGLYKNKSKHFDISKKNKKQKDPLNLSSKIKKDKFTLSLENIENMSRILEPPIFDMKNPPKKLKTLIVDILLKLLEIIQKYSKIIYFYLLDFLKNSFEKIKNHKKANIAENKIIQNYTQVNLW